MTEVGWHHRLNAHEFEQAPRDSEGQGCLVCCSSWGHRGSDQSPVHSQSSSVAERTGESHPEPGPRPKACPAAPRRLGGPGGRAGSAGRGAPARCGNFEISSEGWEGAQLLLQDRWNIFVPGPALDIRGSAPDLLASFLMNPCACHSDG